MAVVKMNVQSFIDAIKRLGFYIDGNQQPNTFEIRNRSVASDDDCSDDERDDDFYERYSDKYYRWIGRIRPQVEAFAKTYNVKVTFETASEYGILWVTIV